MEESTKEAVPNATLNEGKEEGAAKAPPDPTKNVKDKPLEMNSSGSMYGNESGAESQSTNGNCNSRA